jgi:phospholipase C
MRALRKMKAAFRVAAAAAGMSLIVAPGMAAPAFAEHHGDSGPSTATPIEHLVVIFQENVSFDHYFGTYPFAANTDGTTFNADEGTPSVNGLGTLFNGVPTGVLLTNNPNAGNSANGANAINPFRLSHSQAATCDQNHAYGPEQMSFDFGLMDAFPATVGSGSCSGFDYGHGKGVVMGYYDGNTVTALWNYAQHFAMSDNSFDTTFGPSTPGLLNLVSGQTGGVTSEINPGSQVIGTTVVGDPDPRFDTCSSPSRTQVLLAGPNIGELLNAKGATWGSFMGGFDLTATNANGTTGCARSNNASTGGTTADYIPHHAFFQYFASTSNPTHTRPTVPPSMYGTSADGANHNYDLHDFFDAMNVGNLPAVSFLKAPAFQDGHAGYSDPLDEQTFIVNTVNAIMTSKFWKSTAIIVLYDDSDGWYDHQMSPIVNSSYTAQDALTGPSKCGNGTLLKDANGVVIQGRCGYGPRQPLLVISPFAKANFVDHSTTDLSSILRFIEDNWGTGQIGGGSFDTLAGQITNMFDFSNTAYGSRRLILNPNTGN